MRYPTYKKLISPLVLAISLSLSLGACSELESVLGPTPPAASGQPGLPPGDSLDAPARSLMAVYMIGSDLEDGRGDPERGGAGTSDLMEMVLGYQALSADQQANIEVIVGFGGANKPGWKGIRYADMPCLIEDSKDGSFGNDSCYSYQEASANLGAHETLSHFLNEVKGRIKRSDKTSFTFWDHGASYMGVGPDMNYPEDGILTMEDLTTSLGQTQSRFDMIGFDACLMGSIEVAQTVQPFARYMVASEELEPGHGWDYQDLIQYIGSNPTASPLAIGKKFVSSFIQSEKHKSPSSNIKTLSLVDLEQYPKVAESLDALANALNNNLEDSYEPLLQAASRSEGYGVQNKGSVEMGVDLKHLASNIKQLQPQLSGEVDQLIAALDSYVLAAEKDNSRPNANGVSIFSPRYPAPIQNNLYSEAAAASKSWRGLSQNFVAKGLNDTEDPKIVSEEVGCADGFNCLTITDNVGVSEAVSLNAVLDPENPNDVIITSTINMGIFSDKAQNIYGLYQWDGTAEVLCNGPCKEDISNGLGIPVNVENQTEDGKLLGSADGLLNNNEVVFYFLADESGIIDFWAVPVSVDEQGNVIMNKEQLSIAAGDTLQFVNMRVNTETGELSFDTSDPLQLTSGPVFDNLALPGQRFYMAVATDLKGNAAVSEPHLVE